MFARIRSAIRASAVHAVLGAVAAVHLVAVLAVGTVAVALPAPAEAQVKASTCFFRNECLKEGTRENCDNEHCFDDSAALGCPKDQGACYTNPPAIPLQIRLGNTTSVVDLGDYIAVFYNYAVSVAGIIAGVMIVVAGYQYLSSAGNDSKVKGAKERIKNALIGLAILFSAYLILNTVNPDTLRLQMPKVEVTRRQTFASCAATELCAPCGVEYVVLTRLSDGKTATSTADCGELTRLKSDLNDAALSQFDVSATCIGRGCAKGDVPGGSTACVDGQYRCKRGDNLQFACGAAPAAAKEGYACQRCKNNGESCGRNGASDECCGGFCADGAAGNVCASGEPGDECDDGKECKSGVCNTGTFNGACTIGSVGAPCNDSSECNKDAGLACATVADGFGTSICLPGTEYSSCDADENCKGGLKCVSLSLGASVCLQREDLLKACDTNADCPSGRCNTLGGRDFCTSGALGAPCEDNNQCVTLGCAAGVCVNGENGGMCDEPLDCASRKCYKGGNGPGVCTSGGAGARCDNDAHCLSNLRCSPDNRCVQRNQ